MTSIAKFSLVAFDCPDPQRLAEFYSTITGWPVTRDSGDWVEIASEAGFKLAFQLAPDHVPPQWPDPAHPQQAHVDFDVTDLAAATEQVLAIGARTAEFQPEPGFTVFLDPAGHPFCLVQADEEPVTVAPI